MKESRKKLTRREFLRSAAVFATAMAATACSTPTPQVITEREEVPIEVTRIVEVEGEPVVEVEEIVVTATAEPAAPKEEAPAALGTFPRSETLIARILTGRVGSPDNFNWWVGW
ncbi:MAG: hypothetical protein ACK2UQ_15440, partial [Anaerolineae bacterium]